MDNDDFREDRIISNRSSASIPPNIQAEYIEFHKKMDTSGGKISDVDFGKTLFSSKTSNKKKKGILLVLAHRRTPEAYTILKRYAKKPDKELAAWVELALNECKMFLENDLREEETTMVMTGAGGDGKRLRYYIVIHSALGTQISSQHKLAVTMHFAEIAEELSCAIEKITFQKDYALLQVLVSFEIAVGNFTEDGLKRCNRKTRMFCDSYLVTNVAKPTMGDIKKFINACPDRRDKIRS